MKRTTVEMGVGLFVLMGILTVGWLTIRLGKMEILGGNYYTVHARFANIAGLKEGAIVDIAGVKIGSVESIRLNQEYMAAEVGMKIEKDVTLSEDVIASVKTSGLIGDKYVKISPGGSSETLKDGDMILETESALDIEELISKYAFGEGT
jgi:phospholipid/cholesterol/gamma-HCH transport system substrate-binding protein